MKCCVSQTTSIGVKDERDVISDRVNVLLFAQVLKPLAKSLGPFGDGAIDAVVEKIFVRDRR
jgi:hypothetical protein